MTAFLKYLRFIIFFLLINFVILSFAFKKTNTLAYESNNTNSINQEELVNLVNKERIKRGLKPVNINNKLVIAAQNKGNDMLKKHYWAHFGPNKESPWQFINQSGYTYQYAGENLAKGFDSSASVHLAWMNSPTHKDNILSPYFDEIGISILQGELISGEGKIFLVVQMFGSYVKGPKYLENVANNTEIIIDSPLNGSIINNNFNITGKINNNNLDFKNLNIFIDQKNIADVGIKDFKYELPITNNYSNKYLEIAVKSPDTTKQTTSIIFNNKGDYLQNYFKQSIQLNLKNEIYKIQLPQHELVSSIKIILGNQDTSIQANPNATTLDFEQDSVNYFLNLSQKQFENLKDQNCKIQLDLKDKTSLEFKIDNLSYLLKEDKNIDLKNQILGTKVNINSNNAFSIIYFVLGVLIILFIFEIIMLIKNKSIHQQRSYLIPMCLCIFIFTLKLVISNGNVI